MKKTFAIFLLAAMLFVSERAEIAQARDNPAKYVLGPDTTQLCPHWDTAVVPEPPKRGYYKKGQRLVFTAWVDNDDPSDGMSSPLVVWMPPLPENLRLDLSPNQPSYGNIFYDSGIPNISDTPVRVRIFCFTKSGETRVLAPGMDPSEIRGIVWLFRRGDSELVVGPHDENDNIYVADIADTRPGAAVGEDCLYIRYAATVIDKPKKK